MSPPAIPDPADLVLRLDKITAQGSCTCNSRAPVEVALHAPMCRYRLIAEARVVLRALIDFGADRRFRKANFELQPTGTGVIHPLAHEIWAAAQLLPGEGIEDGIIRIVRILESVGGSK